MISKKAEKFIEEQFTECKKVGIPFAVGIKNMLIEAVELAEKEIMENSNKTNKKS